MPRPSFLRATPPIDLALGVVLTALGLFIAASPDGGGLIAVLTVPAVTVPVIWRRRAPLGASAALSLGMVVSALPSFDQVRCGVAIPAALLILYSLATGTDRVTAMRGLLLTLAAIVFLAFTDADLGGGALVLFVPLCVGVWGAGRLVASRARAAAALRVRTAELERQRMQTAQLAVDVERTRLTSELDGAVREHLSEIVELAERGERELAGDEAASRGAFARIETASRGSLDEMRGLLGAMRSDGHADRAPRPTLAQLDGLLAQARAGGCVVDLEVAGDRQPLSEGIELAAYRIVEHALAATDAGDSGSVSVRLRFSADVLEVEVEADDRDSREVVEQPIVAAREQVAARGGTLVVRRAGPGRRALCARLPLVTEHA